MTQEEKDLLLKDLSARLPYGVKIYSDIGGDNTLLGIYGDRVFTTCEEPDKHNDYPAECVKPYLRPMSSMTEEEEDEYQECGNKDIAEAYIHLTPQNRIDYLNSHHFDYRGLIPMGLALEAPEDMYKTE